MQQRSVFAPLAGDTMTSLPVSGSPDDAAAERARWRESLRDQALSNAMRKRAAGVPTYSVPEAAALMSISQEYLYRLIQADAFPAVHMRVGRGQGRYVVPARAVERLLDGTSDAGGCIESADMADQWRAGGSGQVAR
jgi:excisionase family DNA binding protein